MLEASMIFLIPKAVSPKLFGLFGKQCYIGYRSEAGHVTVISYISTIIYAR